jgi:hypothetical protein
MESFYISEQCGFSLEWRFFDDKEILRLKYWKSYKFYKKFVAKVGVG